MRNLLLFFLLFPILLFAQTTEWEKLCQLLNKQQANKLEHFLKKKESKIMSIIHDNFIIDNLLNTKRPIQKHFYHREIKLTKVYYGELGRSTDEFMLSYFVYKNRVINVVIYPFNWSNTIDTIIYQYRDTAFCKKIYTHLYPYSLPIEPNVQHFYFLPRQSILFDISCGFVATHPLQFHEIVTLVQAKNKTEILQWCASLIPEVRFYGALGLYGLQQTGLELSEKELELMNQIMSDKRNTFTCYGGIFAPPQFDKMKKELINLLK